MRAQFRLAQVINNLVSNAIKYTRAGGSVSVRVSHRPAPPVAASDQRRRIFFRCAVRDTGIGVSPEVQARLFQPFFQATVGTARLYGGTGLGLSISKNLVEMMGGTIGVESREQVGSTFWFEVPFFVMDLGSSLSTAPSGSIRRASMRAPSLRPGGGVVLLADDNGTNRAVVRTMLQRLHGLTVLEAVDGVDAVELWTRERSRIDLVLMDMQMPRMDGLEATARSKSAPRTRMRGASRVPTRPRAVRALEAELGHDHTPVIACTAAVLPEEREACARVGMDGHLSKPISMKELSRLLATHLMND